MATAEREQKIEAAFKQACVTAGVSGLTYRLFHGDDSGSASEEAIVYPFCMIMAEPIEEIQMNAPLMAMRVVVAVATYYDDDKLHQTLSEKASDVFAALTASSTDTALGLITGADNLGIQGLEYGEPTSTQDGNDQRQVKTYTAHIYDAG